MSDNFADPLGLTSPKVQPSSPSNKSEKSSAPTAPSIAEQIQQTTTAPAPQTIDTFVPWKSKKALILQEFTTNESIGITVVSVSTNFEMDGIDNFNDSLFFFFRVLLIQKVLEKVKMKEIWAIFL